MSLWIVGGGGWHPPFNRTFFNVSLGEILKRAGREKGSRLTLYLVDGSLIDVRVIEELSEHFVTVNGCVHNEPETESRLHVLPYSSIYRIEVARAADHEGRRLGFRWAPISERSRVSHNGQAKGVSVSLGAEGSRTEEESPELLDG